MSEFVSNPLFGLALSILAYLVGMLIYRRFSPSIDNALAFVSCFYHYFSQGDWYFLPRLLSRWGLPEQLDSPFDGGSRDSALQEFSPDEAPCTEYSLW